MQERGRRRRRGPKKKGKDRLAPLTAAHRLDLSRPADEPLGRAELAEMQSHLTFIRRFKTALRLSLNAQEDLVVNGARPPTDRGICRHLLSKIDRASVQKALAREPIASNPELRAELLAGLVRIDPDVSLLLAYLEAIAELASRRQAAQAFSLTVDRLDFAELSATQIAQLLTVIEKTFAEDEQVPVLSGLLQNESFRRALATKGLSDGGPLESTLGPLRAVHEVIAGERPMPSEEDNDRSMRDGTRALLAVGADIVAGYPEAMRARLATLAARWSEEEAFKEPIRRLLNTLPRKDEGYHRLRVQRAEELIRGGEVDEARRLLKAILGAEPDSSWAKLRQQALGWRRVGQVMVSSDKQGRLARGFFLDGDCPCWVRTDGAARAGASSIEAKIQSEVLHPYALPLLANGLADDGTAYVAVAGWARRLDRPLERKPEHRVSLAMEGVELLIALARLGIELPDLDASRLLFSPDGQKHLVLADFSGAVRQDPNHAAIAHAELARAWCLSLLGREGDRGTEILRASLERTRPLPVLHSELVRLRSRDLG